MDPAVATSPPSSTATPPTEAIHYALKAESLQWRSRDARALLCWPIYRTLYLIAIPGAVLLAYALSARFVAPLLLRTLGFVLAAAIILVPLIVRRRRDARLNRALAPSFPKSSDQSFRLRAAGSPVALRRIQDGVAATSDDFEPLVFRVGRAKRPGWRDNLLIIVLFLVVFVGLHAVARLFHMTLPVSGMVGGYAAIAVAFLVWGFGYPTYLRFVPGRLDVLEYPLLGRGLPTLRTVDLRTTRILVLRPHSAELRPREPPNLYIDAGPLPFHPPNALDIALLAAAISTAPTPPLPTTELTG